METTKTACDSEILDKEIFTIHRGVKIYFCEKECLDEFNESPTDFISSDHMRIKLPIVEE